MAKLLSTILLASSKILRIGLPTIVKQIGMSTIKRTRTTILLVVILKASATNHSFSKVNHQE